MSLFDPILPVADVSWALDESHYLGAARRGFGWSDDHGLLVLANPSSRRLPQQRWLELVRWCLNGKPNAGSRQWALVAAWLRANRPDVSTVVSYSDPAAGHTGSLYRACNWLWAPTWHRLVPPPTGNGRWAEGSRQESVKDRWVFLLRPDDDREGLLQLDPGMRRRFPEETYREPRWRGLRVVQGTGGGRWSKGGRG
jgi:hypothetical protein